MIFKRKTIRALAVSLTIAIVLLSSLMLFSTAQVIQAPPLDANYIGQALGTQVVVANNQTGIVTAVLVRQSPTITINGTVANNFTLMNSIAEFMIPPGSTTNQTVYARGFFGLLENETNTAIRQAVTYNMTILNLHPFALQDQPKLQFLHWETRGNLTNNPL